MCIKTVHSKRFINNYLTTTKFIITSHEKTNYFTNPKKTTAAALIIEETNYFTNPKKTTAAALKKYKKKLS
jgi:hypothetical protein